MSEKPAQEGHTLRITRVLSAPPAEVFAAWTHPDSIRKFMAPPPFSVPEAEMDAREGGRFRIVMRGEQGDYVHEGEYREISPPHKLVFTWISKATAGKETLVTVELREHGDGTELTLTHAGLPTAEMRDRHDSGWSGIVDKLAGLFGGT